MCNNNNGFSFYCSYMIVTFEGNDLAGWVHDGGVSWDWPPDGIAAVSHVYDNHLWAVPNLLPHTDKLVWLHGQCAEADVGGIDPNVLELKSVWMDVIIIREGSSVQISITVI